MHINIFFRNAVYVIASALVVLLDWEIQPEAYGRPRHRIRKSLKRRCMGKMRRLAVLIRRLIFLMALSIELAPVEPHEGRNYFRDEPMPGARRWKGFRTIPGKSVVFPGGGAAAALAKSALRPANRSPAVPTYCCSAAFWL